MKSALQIAHSSGALISLHFQALGSPAHAPHHPSLPDERTSRRLLKLAASFSAMLPLSPSWYPCRDLTCCCNIDKCLHCEEFIMAVRRNPQRICQEVMLPPVAACKLQPIIVETKELSHNRKERLPIFQRRTKRATAESQRRKRRPSLPQIHRPTDDTSFPFFKLPRELRDQIYSSLVTRTDGGRSIISAVSLLNDKKARRAAHVKRERLNRKRMLNGKPPVRTRDTEPEPVVYLNFLQTSRRLCDEARDCLYSSNWFALTLDKLPLTTFETPYGWNLSKIARLQLEVQLKDAAHMNSYVNWTAFFSTFTSLRSLHIAPTFHPRYHDWSFPELNDWPTAHYIHKAFFRELLAGIPHQIDVTFGTKIADDIDLQLQGMPVSQKVITDMYSDLRPR